MIARMKKRKPLRRKRESPHAAGVLEDAFAKEAWKPGTMLCPVPAVMVTCADAAGRPDIVTVAWAGTVCSEPPLVTISLRKERYSYGIIAQSREFVINVPSARQIRATDYCGVVSGRDVDKFEKTGLTAVPAAAVQAPLILECPIHLECRVLDTRELGSHTMFLAEVVAVQVTKRLITPSGRLAIERAGLAAFAHGGYYVLGKKLGGFGYSVQRRGT